MRHEDLASATRKDLAGQEEMASSSPSAPITERNPLHRQFLHPHILLDLARDPPPAILSSPSPRS